MGRAVQGSYSEDFFQQLVGKLRPFLKSKGRWMLSGDERREQIKCSTCGHGVAIMV